MNYDLRTIHGHIPPVYATKDHWDELDKCTFGDMSIDKIASNNPYVISRDYIAKWCSALFYAGTTLYLWNEAAEIKIAFLSACSLKEGQRLFLIGKYLDESGLISALRSVTGESGSILAEEIGQQAIDSIAKLSNCSENKLKWEFNYLDSLDDKSVERVILFGAASHVADWNVFSRQINRVLTDDGKLIIADAPLGGKSFINALHMDAHYEGFILRVLSGMGISENDLPDIDEERLDLIFKPYLNTVRHRSFDGIYLFHGQKGNNNDISFWKFPDFTEEIASFLEVKPVKTLWDFITDSEKACWGPVITEMTKLDMVNFVLWGAGNLVWLWHNNRDITDIMWSNLLVKPGDKVMVISEIPEDLSVIGELRERIGNESEIVNVNMVPGGYNYKDWQRRRSQITSHGNPEEWPYDFADDYSDNYFDLIFLPQGVHHSNNWLRDAPRLLRALKPGHQFMALECGVLRPEMLAAREKNSLLRLVGDRVFGTAFPEGPLVPNNGPHPLPPEIKHEGRPFHDVSTDHLREAFGDTLTDICSIENKGWILFWGYKNK